MSPTLAELIKANENEVLIVNKAPIIGLLKRNNKVTPVLHPILKHIFRSEYSDKRDSLDSIIYTDSFKSYNALGVSKFTCYGIYHSKTFVNDKNHIEGIEKF